MGAVLRILKARHGDAFIFECKKDEKEFVMMIDSGPRLCIKEIVPIIKQLHQIDLLVLTHYGRPYFRLYRVF